MSHTERCCALIDRFIAACQADPRVLAATLYGSYARGAADEHSDLDLGLVTTDAAYDEFIAGIDAFIRLLGEPLFVENFDVSDMAFVIFADGVELELMFGREGRFDRGHGGPYEVLLDRRNLLAGATFPRNLPSQDEQIETLRRLVYWFWHDLSHLIAALSRGQLWWASGQLEELRRTCVKLAILHHDFSAKVDWDDPYFKIEQSLPVEQLSPLQASLCPLEPAALSEAAHILLTFCRDRAQPLAQAHGIRYPVELDRMMSDRLARLR